MLFPQKIKNTLHDATFYLGAILLAGAATLSLFGPGGEQDVLMALGPLAMMGIGVGTSVFSSLLGNYINKKFNEKPSYPEIEPPNLTDPVSAIFDRQRSKLQDQINERSDKAEATAAAKNLSASGHAAMMEPVYDSNAGAMADLSAEEAQAMNDAERQEEMMEYEAKTNQQMGQYQQDLQSYRNRAQAIGGISNSIGSGVSNYFSGKMLDQMLSNNDGGGGGGGGEGGGQNPLFPLLTMDFTKQGIASRNTSGLSGGY